MGDGRRTRRLAAIVAADVVGYSRLMGVDEEGTLDALRGLRTELIDPELAEHSGRIVKTMGDGLLLEFPSIVDAVRFSTRVQHAMGTRNADVPAERRVEFRVGVNVGDVIVEGDDIFGDGVNIAARLEGIADPGGVCISDAARHQVQGRLDIVTEDMGERSLKNIEAPVRAYRIRAATDSRPETVGATPSPAAQDVISLPAARPSLAILPFRSQSANPDAAFIADGIALGVQALFVQLPSLFFVNACMHQGYREQRATAAQALADMPVRYAVEGTVQEAAGRVRVHVQVSDLENGALVWADTYDRDIEDIFALQDEITRHIVGNLSIELVGGHLARNFTAGLNTPDAWEHFLRGLNHFYRWTKRDCELAIPHFEALASDHPDNAIGPSYLSVLHLYAANRNWAASTEQALADAEAWARKAVSLEEGNNGLGYAVLGAIALQQRRHTESLDLCRTAIGYRANCPFAIGQLGVTRTYTGDPDGGIKHAREAMSLRLIQPPTLVNALAIAYRDSGAFDLSIPAAEEAARLDPSFSDALVTQCSDYALGGDAARATQAAQQVLAAAPDFTVAEYARQQPYRDAATLERISGALKTAGLPR